MLSTRCWRHASRMEHGSLQHDVAKLEIEAIETKGDQNWDKEHWSLRKENSTPDDTAYSTTRTAHFAKNKNVSKTSAPIRSMQVLICSLLLDETLIDCFLIERSRQRAASKHQHQRLHCPHQLCSSQQNFGLPSLWLLRLEAGRQEVAPPHCYTPVVVEHSLPSDSSDCTGFGRSHILAAAMPDTGTGA